MLRICRMFSKFLSTNRNWLLRRRILVKHSWNIVGISILAPPPLAHLLDHGLSGLAIDVSLPALSTNQRSVFKIHDIDQSEASITCPGTAQVRMTILLALLLRLFRNLASSSAGMCSPTSSSVQQFWSRRKLNDFHHNIWRRPSI